MPQKTVANYEKEWLVVIMRCCRFCADCSKIPNVLHIRKDVESDGDLEEAPE